MAKHRENMLEAFQASTAQAQRAASQVSSSALSRTSSGTDRGITPGGSRGARPASLAGSLPPEGLTLPMGAVPFLALALALLGLVFLMGYFAGRDGRPGDGTGRDPNDGAAAFAAGDFRLQKPSGIRYGETQSRNDRGAGNAVLPAREDPDAPTAADRAFRDPANLYTVAVFTADDTEFGRGKVRALRDYLRFKGYPAVAAFKSPDPQMAVLCAGAAPRMADLTKLRDDLRQITGIEGRGRPCQDAWVDNIDHYR